jgi:hypothetical protein
MEGDFGDLGIDGRIKLQDWKGEVCASPVAVMTGQDRLTSMKEREFLD